MKNLAICLIALVSVNVFPAKVQASTSPDPTLPISLVCVTTTKDPLDAEIFAVEIFKDPKAPTTIFAQLKLLSPRSGKPMFRNQSQFIFHQSNKNSPKFDFIDKVKSKIMTCEIDGVAQGNPAVSRGN